MLGSSKPIASNIGFSLRAKAPAWDHSLRSELLSRLAKTAGLAIILQSNKITLNLATTLQAHGIDPAKWEASLPAGFYHQLSILWRIPEDKAFQKAAVELGQTLCRKRETRDLGLQLLAWAQEHLKEGALLSQAQAAEQKALGVGLSLSERVGRVAESAQYALGDGVGLSSMVIGQGFGMAGKYSALKLLRKQPGWIKVLGSGFAGYGAEGAGFVVGHHLLAHQNQDLLTALKSSYGMLGSLRFGGGLANGGLFLLGAKGAGLRQVGSKLGMASGLGVWHGYVSPALGLGQHSDPLQGVVEDFVAFEAMGGVLGLSSRYQRVQEGFHQETERLLQQSSVRLSQVFAKSRIPVFAPAGVLATPQGVSIPSHSSTAIPELRGPVMMGGWKLFGGRKNGTVLTTAENSGRVSQSPNSSQVPQRASPRRTGMKVWFKNLSQRLGFTGPPVHVGKFKSWFFNKSTFGIEPDAFLAMGLRGTPLSSQLTAHLISRGHQDRFQTWLEAEPVHVRDWFTPAFHLEPQMILSGSYGDPGPSRFGESFSRDTWISMSNQYGKDFPQLAVARWRYLREHLDRGDSEVLGFFTQEIDGWLTRSFPKGLKPEAFEILADEYYVREFPETFVEQWKEISPLIGKDVTLERHAEIFNPKPSASLTQKLQRFAQKIILIPGEVVAGAIVRKIDSAEVEAKFLREIAETEWVKERVGRGEDQNKLVADILRYAQKRENMREPTGLEDLYFYSHDGQYSLTREQLDGVVLMAEEALTRLEQLNTPEANQVLIRILALAEKESVQASHSHGKDILDPNFKFSDMTQVYRHPQAALYQRAAESLVRRNASEALSTFARNATHPDPIIAKASLRGLVQLAQKGYQEALNALFTKGMQVATHHPEAHGVITPADLAAAMRRLDPSWWHGAQNKTRNWYEALERMSLGEDGAEAQVQQAFAELTSYLEQRRYQDLP